MPPDASLISGVTGNVTIEGGTFTMNVRQTTVTKGLASDDFNNLCSVLDSANAKQNNDLEHIVESRMQKLDKKLEDHQNAISSAVQRFQPPLSTEDFLQQDGARTLLSRAQQLVRLLPAAHRDLALQFAGALRPHTHTRRFNDNLVLVGAPLLSSSIFSSFPAEVQFMVFYFLVAMIFVDVFHPRLISNKPSSRVSVLDALGKYHDFPWSTCENPVAFHAEFLRRFLNQTGFPFVKSRLYEVEYNGSIMKPEDWAAVKPFTDLFVNFVLIQQGGRSRVVKCPWCKRENPLSPLSDSGASTTKCSCSECGRDFSAAYASSTEDDGDHTPPLGLDKFISSEIRRFRIKIQSLNQRFFPTTSAGYPSPWTNHPTAYLPFNSPSPYQVFSPIFPDNGGTPWGPPPKTYPIYAPWTPAPSVASSNTNNSFSVDWTGYPSGNQTPLPGPLRHSPYQSPFSTWGYSAPSASYPATPETSLPPRVPSYTPWPGHQQRPWMPPLNDDATDSDA